MRIFNQYLLLLVLAACIINITFASLGQRDLSVYFVVNVLAYLIITILHAYLNPRARQLLSTISAVMFAGFVIVVMVKILEVI